MGNQGRPRAGARPWPGTQSCSPLWAWRRVRPHQRRLSLVSRWEAARDFLSRQPGYGSTRLHRALRPDARFHLINMAEWTSAEAFQAATARMQRELAAAPPPGLRFTPSLYRVIRE